MMKERFTVLDLLKIDSQEHSLKLKCIAGRNGLDRDIESKDINRPGLTLAGYFEFFAYNRIQLFGRGETMFLKSIEKKDSNKYPADSIEKFMEYKIPCCIFVEGEYPPNIIIENANKNGVPILISDLTSSKIITGLNQILGEVFASKIIMHGVLVEVFGIGILIKGKSGIGKSETALELLERGHRLVADDTIEIKSVQDNFLVGRGTRVISHHMEIRGIGIINVKHLFGVGAIRFDKRIQLVVELEDWDKDHEYERIGTDDKTTTILDIDVPYILIPIMPGRNIPIIIETAAMNHRLKMMGINSAKEFNKELTDYLETEELKNTFFNIE